MSEGVCAFRSSSDLIDLSQTAKAHRERARADSDPAFRDTRRKVLGRALCDKVADPYAPLGVDVIPTMIVLASARYVASWHTVSPWPTTVLAGPASIGWKRYAAVAESLALLSDRRLRDLLDGSAVVGTGIGGTTSVVHVDGKPVFVKQVPLTDLERRPEHVMSTANLFDLPLGCQYGVGSPSFGVWRETGRARHDVELGAGRSHRRLPAPLPLAGAGRPPSGVV